MRFLQCLDSSRTIFAQSRVAIFSFGLAIAFAASNLQAAPVVTTEALYSGNSSALFAVDGASPGEMGLVSWEVDGVEHMEQQWFFVRTANDLGREHAVGTNELAYVSSAATDFGTSSGDFFLMANYADTTGLDTYEVQLRYLLTGGTTGSERSDLTEVILITNTGNDPLDLTFYQYVDFDLNDSEGDDRVVITGDPENTARQTDPALEISEVVVTPQPRHWMAGEAGTIFGMLDDADADDLADVSGPVLGAADAAWSFQWDFNIEPGGSVIISKDKSIRPGGHIVPEPSSGLLAVMALWGMMGFGRRNKNR